MKKLKIYLAVTSIAFIASHAQAGSDLCLARFPEGVCGPIIKIACEYKSGSGSKQYINFKLAEQGDFRHLDGSTVQLKMNDSEKSTSFVVQREVKGSRTTVHLFFRGQFFINDIHLSFDQETRTKTLFNPVDGQWIVDHPPVIQMDCRFVWPNH